MDLRLQRRVSQLIQEGYEKKRMTVLAHPVLAMVFGGFILCAETCLHFPDMLAMRSWVDFPLNDWFAGGFLVYGGIATRRDWLNGRAVQAAAWAFMCSLLAAAFIAHWDDWTTATKSEDDWISPRGVVAIIGVLLIISVGGMVSTLAKQREQP